MPTINENGKAVKPAYESLSCNLLEIEPQGVLCGSNSGHSDGDLFGGLGPYRGSAL